MRGEARQRHAPVARSDGRERGRPAPGRRDADALGHPPRCIGANASCRRSASVSAHADPRAQRRAQGVELARRSRDGRNPLARDMVDQPPTAQLIQSPYDLDARYGTKRDMKWVGYKTYLSETCDEGYPQTSPKQTLLVNAI